MSILLNDNLSIQAPKPADSRYGPHNDLATALSSILVTNRYQGLTVGILISGSPVEYWFKDGVGDANLIVKVEDTANTASANTVYTQGVDATQNTWIISTNTFAGSAYEQANIATIQSQSAFDYANTILTTAANTFVSKSGDTITGIINMTSTQQSVSNSTGSLVVTGGMGISGNLNGTTIYSTSIYSNNYYGVIDAGNF